MQNDDSQTANSKNISRKGFIDVLLAAFVFAWIGFFSYIAAKFLNPPKRTPSASGRVKCKRKLSQFSKNSSTMLSIDGQPVLLIRNVSGEFAAFSAECTHLGCTVYYDSTHGRIVCPCHDGRFDLKGKNIHGPAPKPLTSFAVQLEGEEIYVSIPKA